MSYSAFPDIIRVHLWRSSVCPRSFPMTFSLSISSSRNQDEIVYAREVVCPNSLIAPQPYAIRRESGPDPKTRRGHQQDSEGHRNRNVESYTAPSTTESRGGVELGNAPPEGIRPGSGCWRPAGWVRLDARQRSITWRRGTWLVDGSGK